MGRAARTATPAPGSTPGSGRTLTSGRSRPRPTIGTSTLGRAIRRRIASAIGRCSFSGRTAASSVASTRARTGRVLGPSTGCSSATPARAATTDRLLTGGGLLEGLLGVVARADQRAGRHRLEAHRVGLALELGELVGVPVADHRQVIDRGPQVLADREHLHVVLAEDPECLEQLL